MKRLSGTKRIKLTYYLVLILITLSLTCVGFSSWIMTSPSTATVNGGTFTAYDVITADNYVSLDTTKGENGSGITPFTISNTGFVNGSETSYTGAITAHYKLDLAQLKADYNASQVTIKIYLRAESYSDSSALAIFSSSVMSCTLTCNDLALTPTGTSNASATEYIVSFTCAVTETKTTFDLSFNFTLQSSSYESFYSQITNGSDMSNFYVHSQVII